MKVFTDTLRIIVAVVFRPLCMSHAWQGFVKYGLGWDVGLSQTQLRKEEHFVIATSAECSRTVVPFFNHCRCVAFVGWRADWGFIVVASLQSSGLLQALRAESRAKHSDTGPNVPCFPF